MGTVTDSKTKEPIPFVTVAFQGIPVGTTTDFNGKYSLETKKPGDSLYVRCLGYVNVSRKIQKNKFQVIDFELNSVSLTLQEVVIKPGRNPAEVILEKVIKNKKFNDQKKFDYYQDEAYNKVEVDINNLNSKYVNSWLFKPFKFIFDYVDTSAVNGKVYLPIFISEVLSDCYHRKSPKTNREIIKATKNSKIPVSNKSISQFLGNFYLTVDIYDNYIILLDKNFISPVADFGLGFYKYYLLDSAFIGNKWCYKIMFKPRRKQELTFTGNMWVNDSSWAIRKVNLRIADDVNINYVSDLVCSQDYEPIDNKYWMLSKENFTVDGNIIVESKKILGLYGRKTSSYSKFVFNTPADKKIYNSPNDVIVKDEASAKTEDFWVKNRHDTLDKKEQSIYKMVDSLNKNSTFRTYGDFAKMLATGYYTVGDFMFGTYLTLYSFDQLEGNRFCLNVRTSNKFSTSIMPTAYLAYGTLDPKLKYGGGIQYMLDKAPRRDFGFYYQKDVEQLGESFNSFQDDNIVNSLLRRSPDNKLTHYEEYKAFYEHEWFNGFTNTINFFRTNMSPLNLTPINPLITNAGSEFQFSDNYKNRIEMNSITSTELRLDLRFAYKEKYVRGEFQRINVTAYYPVLNIQYTHGFKGLWNGDYNYNKLVFGLEQWFNIRSFGYSDYILEAGKVFNQLPFPLLKLLEGNETITFDPYAYNRMNYYEFFADEYFSFFYSHHFDGYFLNHIPLMRKLKWREVVWVKGVVGSVDNSNLSYNQIEMQKTSLNPLTKPYYETGVAIENIFKIIRIDATWRLSYLKDNDYFYPLHHQPPSPFGIMFTVQFIL